MAWSRLTGLLLLALAGLCGFFGVSWLGAVVDPAGSVLADLVVASLWWLLLAACVIGAYYDFRRA